MFTIGQKVCLWKVSYQEVVLRMIVTREVIVTITETRNDVPSKIDSKPSHFQSLKAVDDQGKVYEKHWIEWPGDASDNINGQWSPRDEGSGINRFWTPFEAVYVYNEAMRRKSQGYQLIDMRGLAIVPTGDVNHCGRHNRYYHLYDECFFCSADGRRV